MHIGGGPSNPGMGGCLVQHVWQEVNKKLQKVKPPWEHSLGQTGAVRVCGSNPMMLKNANLKGVSTWVASSIL